MNKVLPDITPEMFYIFFTVNFLFLLIVFLVSISNRLKLKRLRLKYNKFMNGLSDRNIEQLLDECIGMVNEVKKKSREMELHINKIDRNILQSIQKIGIVRFNAFENVGSDLSFSIALLNNNDDGVVLSGIYSRDNSAIYAKPVTAGSSRYALSAEEMQAIDISRKIYSERMYTDK